MPPALHVERVPVLHKPSGALVVVFVGFVMDNPMRSDVRTIWSSGIEPLLTPTRKFLIVYGAQGI